MALGARIRFTNNQFGVFQDGADGRQSLLATFGTLAAAQAAYPEATPDANAIEVAAADVADVSVISQFISLLRSDTAWSCGLGLVSIVVPFIFNDGRLFFSEFLLFVPFIVMPLVGIFLGLHAITGGRLAGGIAGSALSGIGGIFTIISVLGAGLSAG